MRLFISHGLDKKNTAEMQFLATLVKALQAPATASEAQAEVLVDRDRLQAGDPWRDLLHEWLAECDAAVLLLTPRGLDSAWVLKEATVLAWRKAMQPGFPFHQVLLDGLQAEALGAKAFSPLCLGDLQAIRPAQGGPLDATTAKAVARHLRQRLQQWQQGVGSLPASPLAALQRALQHRIQKAADPAALERLCNALTGRPLQWRPAALATAEPARLIAAALVNGPPVADDGAAADLARAPAADDSPLSKLVQGLHDHCGLARADTAELLDRLQPLWTAARTAALLADVAGRNRLPAVAGGQPPPGTSVLLQCDDPLFSAEQHVRRVVLPSAPGQVLCMLPGGHSDNRLEELKHAVRTACRTAYQLPASISDSAIDKQLARHDRELASHSRSVFFVVPEPLPDAGLLAELQAAYPRLTFILHSATAPASTLPPRLLALPPVDPDRELAMRIDLSDARNLCSPG